jgi:predicted transcriptional regulator
MSRFFLENLWKAITKETETDTLICQVQAAKEIIDEVGEGILNQDSVNAIAKILIDIYNNSDNRIKENNELAKNETAEDEDEQLDEDDLEVIKEENNNEYDL